MPTMMSLFVIRRRDITARTRRAVAMLSSAPCSVSRACVMVSRCRWRSPRMLVPSSCRYGQAKVLMVMQGMLLALNSFHQSMAQGFYQLEYDLRTLQKARRTSRIRGTRASDRDDVKAQATTSCKLKYVWVALFCRFSKQQAAYMGMASGTAKDCAAGGSTTCHDAAWWKLHLPSVVGMQECMRLAHAPYGGRRRAPRFRAAAADPAGCGIRSWPAARCRQACAPAGQRWCCSSRPPTPALLSPQPPALLPPTPATATPPGPVGNGLQARR